MTQLIIALRRNETEPLTGAIETVAKGLLALPERLFRTLAVWQRRYEERRHLAELDDRLLDDAGLDRGAVEAEVSKPVWRA